MIGLETGSARLFNTYMKGKTYPYKANQWRDVVLKGMEILNRRQLVSVLPFHHRFARRNRRRYEAVARPALDLRQAKGMFVPTFFVPLENTRMEQKSSAKLIEMTDLQWEFFFTCWKLNLEFWRSGSRSNLKFTAGAPIYYSLLGKKLWRAGLVVKKTIVSGFHRL